MDEVHNVSKYMLTQMNAFQRLKTILVSLRINKIIVIEWRDTESVRSTCIPMNSHA